MTIAEATHPQFRGLEFNAGLGQYTCKICGVDFTQEQTTAWEIHKLNHTLVALKNIIDKAVNTGDRLY